VEVRAILAAASDGRPDVFLHIGTSKTGTTYLQSVLWHNRDALRRAGLLYPGLSSDAHFRAATDLCDTDFADHPDPLAAGAWARLVDQARAWRGPVVLSHELLSLASPGAVSAALRDLSWARVHLVCTARDLARQIPATWQEDVKNRQVLSFTEFTTELKSAPAPDAHHLANLFWRLQDTPSVLRNWAGALPPERVHVVTVPPRDAPRHLLWTRFSEAIGLEPGCVGTELAAGSNTSMGVAETNLLRRLNLRLTDELDWPSYDVLVKDHLALSVLGRRAGRPLVLPAGEHGWVAERADRIVGELAAAGYHVIGDLEELRPRQPDDAVHNDPDSVSEAEMLDAAVHAMVGLLQWARDNSEPPRPGWRRTAARLSQQHAGLRRLHHHYLATKARLVDQRKGRG
jgi:hypothetical protein